MPRSLHHLLGVGILCLVFVVDGSVVRTQSSSQSDPLRVTVNFLAVDDDGQPVDDLSAGEVTLRVAGRTRVIESLRFVEFSAAGATAADEADATLPLEPYTATVGEVAGDVRSVMILFNDATIQSGTEADIVAAVNGFIDALGPDTRVALMTTPHGMNNVEFTTDREALLAGLAMVRGRATPQLSEDDFTCHTLDALGDMAALMSSMGNATAPTAIAFISGGLADASVTTTSRREGGSACQLRSDSYAALTRLASAARVHMYVLQATGLERSLQGDVGLESLAGVTNGQRWVIGSSGDRVLARVASETSSYYEASFQPDPTERTNEAPLSIDVSREGVTVRAPSSVVFARSRADDREEASVSPQDMLRRTEVFTGLRLKAVGATSRIGPAMEKLRVLALMEPIDRSVELDAAAAGLISEDGRLVAQWTARDEELAAYPVMVALEAEPGRYRLRMAATDVDGRAGAVDATLNVHLRQADNVQLSDLALLAPRGGDMVPALEFRDEANAVVYFELYGMPAPDLHATIDLARMIDGPALTAVQLQAQQSVEPDKFLITGTLPIRALDPGDYVVRVTIGRDPQVTMYKTIRKLQPGT